MTIFWQPWSIGSCLKQRIIPLYGHTTYGHMSLTTVNDKSLWTKLKKVSLTLVNDKKIVIDHGQWQKKLSLTESNLYRDRPIVHWKCFSCYIHFSKAMFLIGRQNVVVVVGILWIDFRRCWAKRQSQHFYLGQSPFYGHPTICSIKWIKSSQSARLLSLFATEQGQVIENNRDS